MEEESGKTAGEKTNVTENKEVQKDKTYTGTEVITYSAIVGILTGVIGYFIGERRGENKAKEKYEFAVKKWKSKPKGKKDEKEHDEEEFIL